VLIKCDETQDGVVYHLVGGLEHLAVGQFHEAVGQFSKKKHIVFELSGVPCVDSVGLGALIHAVRRTHRMGGEAVVSGANPAVKKWVEIVAIPRTVNMFDNLTAAQAHFRDASDGVNPDRRAA
jgi:anti-sigma B factor antagonist